MTTAMDVIPCEGRRAWRLFERLPELLLGDDPNFIPPFPGSVTGLAKRSHPFHRHGRLFPFLAFRDGRPVGRIAGIVNDTHNNYHRDSVGFFGFFDCIDDLEVASSLLDRAAETVRRAGLTVLRGPFNPTQNDPCGILVDGFDSPPYILMPYNPPHYLSLLERLGFAKARDHYAYVITRDNTTVEDRARRVFDRVLEKSKITFRNVDLKRFDLELGIIESLFNTTLENEWNFMPVTRADLEFAARDLRAILDPDLVLIAEADGKPIGFSMILPNVNELMARAAGSHGLVRLLRLAWYVKTTRPRSVRLAILGVLPEYHRRGIPAIFFLESFRRGKRRYDIGELSWVQDINRDMNAAIAKAGARRYKTYRIVEKALTAD